MPTITFSSLPLAATTWMSGLGIPGHWCPVNQTQTNATTAIASLVYLARCTNPPTDAMFTPVGTGSLYYHTIPTATTWVVQSTATASSHTGVVSHFWPQDLQNRMAGRPELPRPAVHRGRRALRKSIDLFRKIRPETEVKTFLDGEPLIIRGHQFDYCLQKRGDLLRLTMNPDSPHIPYDLYCLDKISGKRLAKGCIVVPGAPVLDQVLALILHVQDVDEEQVVIRTTNWSSRLPLADRPVARAA